MAAINLDDPRTTLRLDPERKKKAHRIATSLNISLNQYIELLIDQADEGGHTPSVSDQIAELQKKTAQLDERLHNLQQKKAK